MIQLVFLERTPATKCQRTRRLQNSAEGGKRRDRIVEGHHTESREHGIRAFRRQIQVLSVCLDQPHLTERLGPAPGDFKEQGGDVHADHLPLRSDPLGELEKSLPGPAPDIENNVSRTETQGFDRPEPQGRKLKVNQQLAAPPGPERA